MSAKLTEYIDRRPGDRFQNFTPDEKIVSHWALAFKELLKFNYSSLIGYDLDSVESIQQLQGLSKNRGGIEWRNYMYSDSYDDEDKLRDNKGHIFAALSIHDALQKYGSVGIGDFICPPDVLEYVKQRKADGKIRESNIPRDEKRYENCKKALEAVLMCNEGKALKGHPIMCLAGAFWVECGWQFEHVINVAEKNGNGNAGTEGTINCGESWFGITFWNTKLQVIRGLNLPCPTSPGSYVEGRMICDLPFNTQAKIVPWWLKNIVWNRGGKQMLEFNDKPPTMERAKECIAASFVQKAGNWKNSGNLWEDALDASNRYMSSVTDAFDGFALQIYMSLMFAKYLKDERVPKGDPW